MGAVLAEIVEGVMRHRLRAAATAFGVFWGTFMLTLLLGAGAGLRKGMYSIFEGNAANAVWIYSGRTTFSHQGLPAGRAIILDAEDVKAIDRGVPELSNVSPMQILPRGEAVRHGSKSVALPAWGVFHTHAAVERLKLLRGRLLNALDVERARRVAIIGTQAR
ncbi:MAG TPA: ABC transporter permease, partial [Polyangiales bacterium]